MGYVACKFICVFSCCDSLTFERSLIFILDIGVVIVDLATQLGSLGHPLAADLIVLVVGNIQLEEAGVRLRETIFVHIFHQTDFMCVAASDIDRKSCSAPYELKILGLLKLTHGFKDAPETCNDLVSFFTVGILCDRA